MLERIQRFHISFSGGELCDCVCRMSNQLTIAMKSYHTIFCNTYDIEEKEQKDIVNHYGN